MGLKTSQAGIDMIKQFEGCVLKVYLDVVGVKTVGYGHTGAEVNAFSVGTKITQQQADAFLITDLLRFEKNVNKYYSQYIWTQNEFDALVSFAYNVGSIDQLTANGTRSKQAIADMMLAYDHAKGKVISGLTRRRKAERELFLKGQQGSNTYSVGKVYTLQSNMYVRDQAAGTKLKYDALTVDGKKNGYFDEYGDAILKKGTKVTCKEVKQIKEATWIRIPSGWVCARGTQKVYIE